jgi:hypothetical protein
MFFNQSPIVLDLCDVSQDGSHHARPLTPEGLQDVLQVSLHKLYMLAALIMFYCVHWHSTSTLANC